MPAPRALTLNLLLSTFGSAATASRLGRASWADIVTPQRYADAARTAEAAGFDAVLLADSPGFATEVVRNTFSVHEPITLLTAIAQYTSSIRLIPSVSTSFTEPYNLARQIASLHLLSGGRAGWNVVTTSNPRAAANFGAAEQPDHDGRYARAAEFVEVVLKLWGSWTANDTFGTDRPARVEPADVTPIEHRGEYFDVRGALNVPGFPYGRPLLSQAGASPAGRDLAGRFADVVYTNQQSIEQALDFARGVREAAARWGRDPEHVRILPGVTTVLGGTEEQARRREHEISHAQDLTELYPAAEKLFRIDLSGYDTEAPFPLADLPAPEQVNGSRGTFTQITAQIELDGLTVGQALRRYTAGQIHRTFVGTPEQLAEQITDWVDVGAADGFTVQPDLLPDGLDAVVEHVVPRLADRLGRVPAPAATR